MFAMAQQKLPAGVRTPAFAQDVVDELKKVTWPTRADTIRLTTIVIVISLIIGSYIGIIDILLTKVLELLAR
jgi:preprotein translocase subunit SecE